MRQMGSIAAAGGVLGFSLGWLLAGAGAALAGPLNPPPGPVASTHKTLTEVEPRTPIGDATTPGDADSVYRITQPGSYYLTGNVSVTTAEAGIEIAAGNVTIDLMGFALRGDADPDGGVPGISLDGIRTDGAHLNITVRNGTVARFGGGGVDLLNDPSSLSHRVEGVHATLNTGPGITVAGGVVVDSTAFGNGETGIDDIGFGSTIERCTAHGNHGAGIRGAEGSVIRGCTAIAGADGGIVAGSRSVVAECVAYNGGIHVNVGSTVTGCSVIGNGSWGITTGAGCTVRGCTVKLGTQGGIELGDNSTVEGCTISDCLGNGIAAANGCTIRGNTCSDGGVPGTSAGIRVTGSDNRIEGNSCNRNDYGIRADAAGNVIVRNTASGNTTANWLIAAGNVCLVVQAATGGAINGNSGGAIPGGAGGTDPSANLTY